MISACAQPQNDPPGEAPEQAPHGTKFSNLLSSGWTCKLKETDNLYRFLAVSNTWEKAPVRVQSWGCRVSSWFDTSARQTWPANRLSARSPLCHALGETWVFATSRCARWDGAGTLRVSDSPGEAGITG